MRTMDRTVLITGGGSGIGLALAHALLDAGNQVVVCGRDAAKLAAARAATPGLLTFTCDVTDAADRHALAAMIRSRHPGLDVLVNNAGILRPVDLVDGPVEAAAVEAEIATNLTAAIHLTTLLLPALRERPDAAVVNVTSGLAYAPMAETPVYCATKAGLHSFTQSLRHQLRDTHVRVFEVLPPTVDTPMSTQLGGPKITADRLAQTIVRSLRRDRVEIRAGQSRLLYALSRIAPALIFRILNARPRVSATAPAEVETP